jgi:hypothetical protein
VDTAVGITLVPLRTARAALMTPMRIRAFQCEVDYRTYWIMTRELYNPICASIAFMFTEPGWPAL